MTPLEILHEIVSTEHNARQLYENAVRKRNSFKEYMNEKTGELRRLRFEEANLRAEEFEKAEIAKADAEIAAIDGQFRQSLDTYREYFEANKEKTAKKMFDMITDPDYGGENV